MGCKTCDERLKELVLLEAGRNQEKRRADFECERADELQEACNRHKERATSALNEAGTLWTSLRKKLAKPSVDELLRIASTASQISKLSGVDQPSVIDEASAVALAALKQVRERLEEGAKDAGDPAEA